MQKPPPIAPATGKKDGGNNTGLTTPPYVWVLMEGKGSDGADVVQLLAVVCMVDDRCGWTDLAKRV